MMSVPQSVVGDTRRGVFRLPFDGAAGEVIIVAISSRGRRVAEVKLEDPHLAPAVQDLLLTLLDVLDPPPPPLQLVR